MACHECDLTAENCDMGLRFLQQKHRTYFFITTTFRDWAPIGNIQGVYPALAKSLVFCAKKYNALIAGYVLMPTHVHVVLFIEGLKLSAFMRDFKKFIAQKVIKDLTGDSSGVWMSRFDRVAIYDDTVLRAKLNYIHHNPVK